MGIVIAIVVAIIAALPATAAHAQTFTEHDQKCIAEQFIWLENEGLAKRETFDEIAKRSLSNCGYEWRPNVYRPAFDYALKNLEFIAIDERKRAQFAAVEKANKARLDKAIKDAEKRQKLMNDCAVGWVETLYRNKKPTTPEENDEYRRQSARECGAWPKNWTDAEIEANGDYLAAYGAAQSRLFQLSLDDFIATPNAKPVKSVKLDDKNDSRPLSSGDWAFIVFMAVGVVITLRDMVSKRRERRQQATAFDLPKTEWRKARIEPIFDIRPDNPWH